MEVEGVIFKKGEIPKTLFKIINGTVRETRNKSYYDLGPGDFIALIEYFLGLPIKEDIVALERAQISEVTLEKEYTQIIKKMIDLRKILSKTSIDISNLVLDDFQFEEENLDDYLNEIEALLTLSSGELSDDKDEALKSIMELEDDKLLTKINLIRRFIEKFPEEKEGAKLLIEGATKAYIILNEKFLAKAFLKKVLLLYPKQFEECF
ncbi:MAG: cyclic nucleotide-binding domain-containing protein, partial [Fervidobacterium sp.]